MICYVDKICTISENIHTPNKTKSKRSLHDDDHYVKMAASMRVGGSKPSDNSLLKCWISPKD